jgi:FixJ family two-component response regulator
MTAQHHADEKLQRVYVVDDDPSARTSLCWLLNTEDIANRAFASAEAFLEQWNNSWTGCITVDIRMPGMTGLQLQEELNVRNNLLPVIVLTGHADVPIAIRAMKLGAYDFLEKPYSDNELLNCVKTALQQGEVIDHLELERNWAANAIGMLTEREREVMNLVVGGNTNKSVAADLGISEKTVEAHRSRVMQKTAAKSFSELVRISLIFNGKP